MFIAGFDALVSALVEDAFGASLPAGFAPRELWGSIHASGEGPLERIVGAIEKDGYDLMVEKPDPIY